MKKLLLFTLIIFSVLQLHAENHLTFCGVQIDGELSSFMLQLEEQGFTSEIKDGTGVMTGTFMGQEVGIIITTTPKSHNVFSLVAMVESNSKWAVLETIYRNMVDSLQAVYGTPKETIWDVAEDANPKREVAKKRATIKTVFETNEGGIIVGIDKVPFLGLMVWVAYFDKANTTINEEESNNTSNV